MARGLEWFPNCFNSYFNSVLTEGRIKIFGCVTLINGTLICATNLFHGHPWFSNVSIAMNSEELFDEEYQSDSGNCFAKVCIM